MRKLWLVGLLFMLALPASAQQEKAKRSALQPPPGQDVALVVFEDMQCPDCGRAHPIVHAAAEEHKIPIVRYDFPLPNHNWAFDAAVLARWFEGRSPKLADLFRGHIYENQRNITRENLRGYAQRFAAQHNLSMPFVLDPQEKLAAAVKKDYQLGQKIGISHTPTIYVVTRAATAQPFIEVVDRSRLSDLIRAAKAEAAANKRPGTVTKKNRKAS